MTHNVNVEALPVHMQEGAREYVLDGRPTGGFLRAVLENKLVEAALRADHLNLNSLATWAGWLYHECPSRAWGSREAYDAWVAVGGLRGLYARSETKP